MVVDPFTAAETGDMIGAEPAAAIDAQLIIGGYPGLAAEWQPGQSPTDFLRGQLNESTSPLVVVGERMLMVELPSRSPGRCGPPPCDRCRLAHVRGSP